MMQAAVSPWASTKSMPSSAAAPIMSRLGPPPGTPKSFRTPAACRPSAIAAASSRGMQPPARMRVPEHRSAEPGFRHVLDALRDAGYSPALPTARKPLDLQDREPHMAIRVAHFKDVAEGTQPGQFTV